MIKQATLPTGQVLTYGASGNIISWTSHRMPVEVTTATTKNVAMLCTSLGFENEQALINFVDWNNGTDSQYTRFVRALLRLQDFYLQVMQNVWQGDWMHNRDRYQLVQDAERWVNDNLHSSDTLPAYLDMLEYLMYATCENYDAEEVEQTMEMLLDKQLGYLMRHVKYGRFYIDGSRDAYDSPYTASVGDCFNPYARTNQDDYTNVISTILNGLMYGCSSLNQANMERHFEIAAHDAAEQALNAELVAELNRVRPTDDETDTAAGGLFA